MECRELISSQEQNKIKNKQINKREMEKILLNCKNKNKTHPIKMPYIQYIHLHRLDDKVKEFAIAEKFGKVSSELLQVPKIRLYQTSAFFKESVGSIYNQITAWHRDLNLVPLDTNNFLTFWCPLHSMKQNDSILQYASKSQKDVAFLHWFPGEDQSTNITAIIKERYKIENHNSYNVGDCSVHHGWTWHFAQINSNLTPREAVAFSFVDGNALLLDQNKRQFEQEDILSWKDWIDEVYENKLKIDHPLLPLVYDSTRADDGS